ncbi:MAG: carbohydrate ABC transporter permease [Deinococcus sp.]|nr:carbohydrate ABC transporter permease [Deinococcus sp.]
MLGDIWTYLAYLLILAFFIVPVLWVLSLSFKTVREVYAYPPRLLPNQLTLDNYHTVLRNAQFPRYLLNSLKIALLASLGTLAISTPAAYAFSRFRFRAKGTLLIGILALQMISPLVILIPLYRYFAALDLLDSHFGVIMVYLATLTPLTTWLLKGFFDGIPISLEDAGQVDGCSRLQVLWRITMPIAVPGLMSAVVLNVILSWSQFVIPFILISKNKLQPVAVGIFNFQGTYQSTATHTVAAASILTMLPAIVIFVALQRFIVRALLAGAVKG